MSIQSRRGNAVCAVLSRPDSSGHEQVSRALTRPTEGCRREPDREFGAWSDPAMDALGDCRWRRIQDV